MGFLCFEVHMRTKGKQNSSFLCYKKPDPSFQITIFFTKLISKLGTKFELREMVSTLQKRFNSSKKLRLARSLATYESPGRQSSAFWNAVLFIHKLKNKLETIEREYSNLLAMKKEYLNSIKQFQALKEVRVEKIGEEYKVKVRCEKGGDRLVSILEVFEKMRLNVVEARVSCNECFSMEAIAVAEDDQLVNVRDIIEAINFSIDGKLLEGIHDQKDVTEKHVEI